ncbi:MAG TPA: hypothetical protein VFE82_06015 [Ramlibacter sp.]|jgi:predicted dienelactone hydrolase|uniref:alpha/beta hydrolase family protein n=1 Tax=Ramlibacter sp. TaxID=1917967 RepID=UPI002D3D4C0A|nr:hypothetical protein [Ramlibacter sp.]HZY18019.1 hypothetical protein [Ramlibacter sp.]
MTLTRRTLLLATPAMAFATRAAAQALPAPQDLAWTDGDGRQLRVLVRWPAAPAGAAALPVVLYSHGLGGSREGGAVWGEAWARAGFVVLHLEHAGSNLEAIRKVRDARLLANARQLVDRFKDVRQALDAVERLHAARDGDWARVRAARFGLAGHSFGAHTTLGMAGERSPTLGSIVEPRLAAFVALSPSLPRTDPQEAFVDIKRPMLCITGTEDGDVLGNGSSPERRRQVFDALPGPARAQLVLQHADHMTLGGTPRARQPRRSRSAIRDEGSHQAVVAALTTDWWRAWLQSDAAAKDRLRQPQGLIGADSWRLA